MVYKLYSSQLNFTKTKNRALTESGGKEVKTTKLQISKRRREYKGGEKEIHLQKKDGRGDNVDIQVIKMELRKIARILGRSFSSIQYQLRKR